VTTDGGCAGIRSALGVYVVGAIGPADRAVVEAHLAWCVDCREELAGLAALPGRLGSVPAADVAGLAMGEPGPGDREAGDRPDAALRGLLDRAVALRRHLMWHRLTAAAAVIVVAAGGAVAVSRVMTPPSALSAASPVLAWATTVHGSNLHTGAAATVRYAAQPWGLQVQAQVSGIPPGTRCELLVLGADGPVTAGGWIVAQGHAAAWYPLSAPSAGSGVRGFVVTTASGKPLVSVPIR
jgi:Putative zinc-finger